MPASSFHLHPLAHAFLRKRLALAAIGAGAWARQGALACLLLLFPLRAGMPAPEAQAVATGPQAGLLATLEAGDRRGLDEAFAAGVPVDTRLPDGDTPLLHAIRARRPDLAAVCLDWCAQPEATGEDRVSALTLAVVTRQTDLAAALAECGASPNYSLPAPLPAAVTAPFEQPWFLTQLKHDPGVTPLMLACVMGDEALVRTLLGNGGRPYQRTRRYTTDALTLACRAGQLRTAQLLLKRDPDDQTGQRLVVGLGEQRVTLLRGAEVVMTSRVSTGRKTHPTPPGEYLITSKHRDWISTIYHVPMPFLLRLNTSAIGLHQGSVPGYPASRGCIRLPAGKAADFFKVARVGDRVLIRH